MFLFFYFTSIFETLPRVQRTNSKLKTMMTPFCRDSVLFFQLAPQIFLVTVPPAALVAGRQCLSQASVRCRGRGVHNITCTMGWVTWYGAPPPLLPSRLGTSSPTSDIWWPLLETYSYTPHQCWHLVMATEAGSTHPTGMLSHFVHAVSGCSMVLAWFLQVSGCYVVVAVCYWMFLVVASCTSLVSGCCM